MSKTSNYIYVAKPAYINELRQEIGAVSAVHNDLLLSSHLVNTAAFALDIWTDVVITPFESISQAANLLKSAGIYWYFHPIENVRRGKLIQEQLRSLPSLESTFPLKKPIPTIGCYTLLDRHTLAYSIKRLKKWPSGHCYFIEDKINPPNRAYLKLWEALTLLDKMPKPNETVFDLGASPGGWTYVMQTFGTKVTAIDKAPLDRKIAMLPNVTFLHQSAFALNPTQLSTPVDWLLSDVACYPARLYELVVKWIEAKAAKNMVLTIKLQGETDQAMLDQFKALPNARVLHLFHNKHEVTFFYPATDPLLLP